MLRVSGALRASSQVPLGLAVVFPVLDLGRTAGGIRIAAGHPLLGSPSAGALLPAVTAGLLCCAALRAAQAGAVNQQVNRIGHSLFRGVSGGLAP